MFSVPQIRVLYFVGIPRSFKVDRIFYHPAECEPRRQAADYVWIVIVKQLFCEINKSKELEILHTECVHFEQLRLLQL